MQLSTGNLPKKLIMTRLKRLIYSAITTSVLVNFIPLKVHADTGLSLTVYAGPQSVAPRQTIHVTVEFTDESGNSMNKGNVEISYLSDGTLKTLSGTPKLGLISFDVPAQNTIGLMTFSAKAADVTSKKALVTVVAGSPLPFKITAQPSKEPETLKLTSNVITDSHGNLISDLSLVSMEWIDFDGLKIRQTVQLLNGQILLTTKCPAKFKSPLIVRASVGAIESVSKDVSADCLGGQVKP